MNRFKTLLTVLISVCALIVGVIFVMRNDQPMVIDFVLFGTSEMSSGAWVLGSFFVGLCVAWLIALPGFVLGKWRISRQRRKIGAQQAALTMVPGEVAPGK